MLHHIAKDSNDGKMLKQMHTFTDHEAIGCIDKNCWKLDDFMWIIMIIFITCCLKIYDDVIVVALKLRSSNALPINILALKIALQSFLQNIFLATDKQKILGCFVHI